MITLPHKFEPRKYQVPFLQAMDSGVRRAVLVWHRRAGKDKTAFNFMIKEAVRVMGTYFYVFPTYSQGKKVVWDEIDAKSNMKVIDHIPKELIEKKNENEMKIELVNGSVIRIIGSDKMDRIVGTNPIGIIFSEYSVQKPDAWDYIRPILTENSGWAVFVYTPRGMNHGYDLYSMAQRNKEWFCQLLTVEDTGVMSADSIQMERDAGMPEDLIQQEYYCKFISGATQYFNRIEQNIWDGELTPIQGRTYQVGLDLAKHQDYTVITPFDRHSFYVGKQDVFNKIDWNLQKARIEAEYHRWNKGRIVMDSTGLGDPIYDDLVAKGIAVTPYKFSEQSRKALLENLRIMLYEDRIKIPNDENLINQLRAFQYDMTDMGRLKIGVPENAHDDMVMSLALAVWGVGQRLQSEEEASNSHRNVFFDDSYGFYGKQTFE